MQIFLPQIFDRRRGSETTANSTRWVEGLFPCPVSELYVIFTLAAVQSEAEDFSWDEEDESPTTAETLETAQNTRPADSESLRASHTLTKAVEAQQNLALKSSEVTDSSNNSTRVSEESYVAVNAQKAKPSSGSVIENVESPAEAATLSEGAVNADGDDDDDSDWE